jgi:hypothetical protein
MVSPRVRIAGLALLLALSSLPASAQQGTPASDPARIAAAKRLFAVSGQEAQFDTVIATMTKGMADLFKQQHPMHGKEIEEGLGALMKKFISRKSEIVEMMAPLYAEKFTVDEINAIAQFYSSPIGQKLVTVQPELTQRSMVLGMDWGKRIGREVETELKSELRKRGVPI